MPFVRGSFFAGEHFIDLADAQRRADEWCATDGGAARPRHDGVPAGRALRRRGGPGACARRRSIPMTCRIYATPKVHRDHHIEVAKALYSVPGNLIGRALEVRADRDAGQGLLPGPAGQGPSPPSTRRALDRPRRPARRTRPSTRMRDLDRLRRHGRRPRPGHRRLRRGAARTTRCRGRRCARSTRCLGLVKKWGADRVEAACARAADAEAFNVALIGRMLERAPKAEDDRCCPPGPAGPGPLRPARRATSPFSQQKRRDPEHRAAPDRATEATTAARPSAMSAPTPVISRRAEDACCARSSSAAASTPSPSASPWPRRATWATPSSSSSSSPTR